MILGQTVLEIYDCLTLWRTTTKERRCLATDRVAFGLSMYNCTHLGNFPNWFMNYLCCCWTRNSDLVHIYRIDSIILLYYNASRLHEMLSYDQCSLHYSHGKTFRSFSISQTHRIETLNVPKEYACYNIYSGISYRWYNTTLRSPFIMSVYWPIVLQCVTHPLLLWSSLVKDEMHL